MKICLVGLLLVACCCAGCARSDRMAPERIDRKLDKVDLKRIYRAKVTELRRDEERSSIREALEDAFWSTISIQRLDREMLSRAAGDAPEETDWENLILAGSASPLRRMETGYRVSGWTHASGGYTVTMYVDPAGRVVLVVAWLTYY